MLYYTTNLCECKHFPQKFSPPPPGRRGERGSQRSRYAVSCCPLRGKYPRSGGKGFAEEHNMSEPPQSLRDSSPNPPRKNPGSFLRGPRGGAEIRAAPLIPTPRPARGSVSFHPAPPHTEPKASVSSRGHPERRRSRSRRISPYFIWRPFDSAQGDEFRTPALSYRPLAPRGGVYLSILPPLIPSRRRVYL